MYDEHTYAVVQRRDPSRIAAGEEDGHRGLGLAGPFYGNDLEDAKEEVKLTFASDGEEDMPVDDWLEKKGWLVVPMNTELGAQYDALFDFEEDP